ncbi:MAG: ATP-grasp domain-containing protein [Treponema sp.]|jgi:biotin carboxylase|nr:ATP-grasp domain-containing protein [Treponema sp.]
MEKERILILGAGVMQGPALNIAREMGLETVVVDADSNAVSIPLADRFEKIDLKDKEKIEAFARSLKENNGLAGIMTAGTDFSASVAWAAAKLSLPGISHETALNASDKERMRRLFRDAGVPSPEFVIITDLPSKTPGFYLPFSWPAVVKPVDNMGSRGCRRVGSMEELENAAIEALKFSRSGRAIVEEYMEGPEFSVDALVYKGEITICGLADRHIFFPPYFIEMGHTMPTNLAPETCSRLLETFKKGVKALGIDNGAAKGDVKLTPYGPMIGEIAARLSGGYMSGWTYPYSSGVLPTRGALQIAVGRKPDQLEPKKSWTCAERAFISIPGRVHSLYGIEDAKAVPFVTDFFTRISEGSRVIFPENNVSKCGNILASAPAREDVVNAAESAARKALIRLAVPDESTEAFLAQSGSAFPPDAFVLDAGLKSLLEKLPDMEISPGSVPCLLAFPEFIDSGLKDYMGRSVEESLAALRLITGLELPLVSPNSGKPFLGRRFWAALARGSYQGAAYIVDRCTSGRI